MTPHYGFLLFVHLLFRIAENVGFLVLLQENLSLDCSEFWTSFSQHTSLCTAPPTKVHQGFSRVTKTKSWGQKEEETGGFFSLKFLCGDFYKARMNLTIREQ